MKAPYDKIAGQWTTSRSSFRPKEAQYLAVLLESADARLPVLDLGCGSGTPIAEFVTRAGYRVVGVDASEMLLTQARRVVPEARLILARMEDVEFDEIFAAIVCWDALFHVERQFHRDVFERVYRWLAPGARFMFSTGGSANPPFTDCMWGHEFFYDSHAPDEVRTIIEAIGFRIVLFDFVELPDGGRNKGKLAVIAEKPQYAPANAGIGQASC